MNYWLSMNNKLYNFYLVIIKYCCIVNVNSPLRVLYVCLSLRNYVINKDQRRCRSVVPWMFYKMLFNIYTGAWWGNPSVWQVETSKCMVHAPVHKMTANLNITKIFIQVNWQTSRPFSSLFKIGWHEVWTYQMDFKACEFL